MQACFHHEIKNKISNCLFDFLFHNLDFFLNFIEKKNISDLFLSIRNSEKKSLNCKEERSPK